jgi:hypothetical protein
MSLLKRLQRDLTCVELPWRPSVYSARVTRLINEIVLGEESDLDPNGAPLSHFELYLKAMQEVGANTKPITEFIVSFDTNLIPYPARSFVGHNLDLIRHADTVEVAAAFFFGREKVIPGMFEGILAVLKRENIPCPLLNYYLERHIHLDGEEHGPMSELCLKELTQGKTHLEQRAFEAGVIALQKRDEFWDEVLKTIKDDNFLVLDTHL